MPVQMRMGVNENRLYAIERDLAHNFPIIATTVATRLEDAPWPFLHEFLAASGTGDAELGEACRVFTEFIASIPEHPDERAVVDALIRVGWMKLPEAAQLAYMAILGTVMIGCYWQGVRDASFGETTDALTYADLRATGLEVSRLLALPPRRRWWARQRARLARWFRPR